MLTGKLNSNSKFEKDDHRNFNRHGEEFDRGETFSGVNYETGLKAVEELKSICPKEMSLTQFALKWILMFDAVTCAIPGAKKVDQVTENVGAADMTALSQKTMEEVNSIYEKYIKQSVHHYW